MTDHEHTAWQVVATRQEVCATGLYDVLVGRHLVLLIAQHDQIFAVQGLCPHQHARLLEGVIVGETLQCPHHLARFNLTDGTCTGGWQLPPLQRYPVRVEGDQVLLPEPLRTLS